MAKVTLDEDGRLPLPADVRAGLGWEPGQEVLLRVEGEHLVVQAATPVASLRDEARRLADAMRGLTRDAAKQVGDLVSGIAERTHTARHPGAHVSSFQGTAPEIPASAYLAPGCTVVGDVMLGEDASVWPGVVIRGDVAPVRIGAGTNIQDGTVVHVSPQRPCVIGSGVTVGHQATVHACNIGDHTLIAIQAVVLDGARIGRHCMIAAGCVVPPDMVVPDGKMVMGVPAKIVRDLSPEEVNRIHWNADSYISLKAQYVNPAPPAALPAPPQAQPKPAPPEPGTLPRYRCVRARGEIRVDGALDDAGWNGVAPMSALMLASGAGPANQETEVRACWDDTHLYVAFACKDSDIWSELTNRDDPLYEEEVVEVFLCPGGDLRHYFEFEVSPRNVIFDARVFNPDGHRGTMEVDTAWDAVHMRTAVRVSGDLDDRSSRDVGWIVELAIPFEDLGLCGPPSPGEVWRANFYRIERGHVTEFSAWSPTRSDPPDFHVPACFGEFVFEAS